MESLAPSFELRILGPTQLVGFDLDQGDANVPAPKRLALLAYLAIETADGYRRRDQIVSVFWPDLGQEAARTQLRKALSGLREHFGSEAVQTRGDGEVRIDDQRVWCDAVALERAAQEHDWSRVLTLYRGELLEGLFPGKVAQEFHDWLADKRKTLRDAAALAAWDCSHAEEEQGDRKAAAVAARRAMDLTPDDEGGVRRLMLLLDRHGDRGGALRVYRDWQARLQSEYGVEPAPETRKLARRVQAARKGESHETPPTPLLALLTPAAPDSTAGDEATTSDGQRRRPPWYVRRMTIAFGTVALMAAVAGLWRATGSGGVAPRSVAVLSLRATGGSEAIAASTAVEEELTAALISTESLTVRPALRRRTSADEQEDVEQIGRRLRVAFLIDGSVRQHADGIRLTLRLVRAADGIAVWGASIDADARGASSLSARAAEVATAVVARIRADAGARARQ